VQCPKRRANAVELANLTSPTLAEVIQQAHLGIERVRRTPHLAYSFLGHTGLSGLMMLSDQAQDFLWEDLHASLAASRPGGA
jgi:hypothetical protein